MAIVVAIVMVAVVVVGARHSDIGDCVLVMIPTMVAAMFVIVMAVVDALAIADGGDYGYGDGADG